MQLLNSFKVTSLYTLKYALDYEFKLIMLNSLYFRSYWHFKMLVVVGAVGNASTARFGVSECFVSCKQLLW